MIRRFAVLLTLFALTGCILVDDFSAKWNAGVADSCVSKISDGLYYSEFRRDPEGKDMSALAHSFKLGNFYFLMLKQDAADKGGRMYRFGIVHGIFQRYRLNPAMKQVFLDTFKDAPVSLSHDTVRLAALGPKEMKLLTDISDINEYWEIEDQVLYNTMLNPLCKYDDRDLKAMNEEAHSKAKK